MQIMTIEQMKQEHRDQQAATRRQCAEWRKKYLGYKEPEVPEQKPEFSFAGLRTGYRTFGYGMPGIRKHKRG